MKDNYFRKNSSLSATEIDYIFFGLTGVVGSVLNCPKYRMDVLDMLEGAPVLFREDYRKDAPERFSVFGVVDNQLSVVYLQFSFGLASITTSTSDIRLRIAYDIKHKKEVDAFVTSLTPYIKEVKTDLEISILMTKNGHIDIHDVNLEPVQLDTQLYYGDGFTNIHDKILDSLESKTSGLYLFYGPPGCGKTTYVKYLSQLSKRKFIFIPSTQIDMLTSPDLLGLLIDYPKSVLILEDAEKAVLSRDDNPNADLVSTLLNLTDGILGNMLDVSVIATFNTNKDKLDKALLRKGRLRVEHDFRKLTKEEAKKVADQLGKTLEVTDDMTLTDIFNCQEDNLHKEKIVPRVGFMT